ncbi:MAG: type II toxin-antitoxin system RelE/ParE family toxin [Actinomycetia bacterium]|nr:type II toxin-antitoxin system RelE/ParE family toxin [Actinomycetes bacterium]
MEDLSAKEFAVVLAHVERLSERGNRLRMPASRSLGDGLFELRFDLGRVARRITYFFVPDTEQRIALLTTFRKQRQNERAEVRPARSAMARCIAEGHTAEEDD